MSSLQIRFNIQALGFGQAGSVEKEELKKLLQGTPLEHLTPANNMNYDNFICWKDGALKTNIPVYFDLQNKKLEAEEQFPANIIEKVALVYDYSDLRSVDKKIIKPGQWRDGEVGILVRPEPTSDNPYKMQLCIVGDSLEDVRKTFYRVLSGESTPSKNEEWKIS